VGGLWGWAHLRDATWKRTAVRLSERLSPDSPLARTFAKGMWTCWLRSELQGGMNFHRVAESIGLLDQAVLFSLDARLFHVNDRDVTRPMIRRRAKSGRKASPVLASRRSWGYCKRIL
jgi:hypothetical protein